MRRANPASGDQGFTLIEAMVAAGIFSVAILGMVTLMERQNASVGGLQTQINLRQILNSAENVYEANNNNFPPAAAAAGAAGGGGASARPITYVGCFQSSGMATANSIANAAFVSVDMGGLDPSQTLSGICDCNPSPAPPAPPGNTVNYLANAEVHVVRTILAPPALNTISFYAFLLPPMNAGSNPNICSPTTYALMAPASPRNWSAAAYRNAPTKILQDTIDITTPP